LGGRHSPHRRRTPRTLSYSTHQRTTHGHRADANKLNALCHCEFCAVVSPVTFGAALGRSTESVIRSSQMNCNYQLSDSHCETPPWPEHVPVW
jgi:hypothetical protein